MFETEVIKLVELLNTNLGATYRSFATFDAEIPNKYLVVSARRTNIVYMDDTVLKSCTLVATIDLFEKAANGNYEASKSSLVDLIHANEYRLQDELDVVDDETVYHGRVVCFKNLIG